MFIHEKPFLNDPYLDLAIVANFVVKNDKDEADYLDRYFGETIDEYKHARFYLYYFIFLILFDKGDKPIDVRKIDKRYFRSFTTVCGTVRIASHMQMQSVNTQ